MMDDKTFGRLIEAAKRGRIDTDAGANVDEGLALATIAADAPNYTPAQIAAAWAAHRGESPFDAVAITDLLS